MPSPFEQLGLPETASIEEVEARWKYLRGRLHPDKGGDQDAFVKTHAAYKDAVDRLKNEVKNEMCLYCGGVGFTMVFTGFCSIPLTCPSCSLIRKR